MEKEIARRSHCYNSNKKQFNRHTVGEALLSIMIDRELGNRTRREKGFYKCPFCLAWHLTSKEQGSITKMYETTAKRIVESTLAVRPVEGTKV